MHNIIFIILIGSMLIILAYLGWKRAYKTYELRKYGNLPKGLIFWERIDSIRAFLSKFTFFVKLYDEISLRLSVFNSFSYEKNTQIATIALILAACVTLVIFIISCIVFFPLWYIALFFACMAVGFCVLGFLVLSSMSLQKLLKHMPGTIKIINSRFASRGSIVKAFAVSINDFHKTIRGEMIRIYDALRQNDTSKIRETFNAIDRKYNNEHMSLLLELIWFAHFNGGDVVIHQQFEEMAKDVVADMENRQDLRAAASSYIIMSICFMGAIPLIRLFNRSVLEGDSMDYYSSKAGILLMIVYIAILMVLIGILAFMERTD